MGLITQRARAVFDNFILHGVSTSGVKPPNKDEIVYQVFALVDVVISTLAAGAALDGVVVKETQALLDADLAHDAETLGFVYGDETEENNGVYVKAGPSGSGGWSLVPGLTLPATFATDIAAAIAAGEAAQAAQTAAEAAQDAAETAAADALEAADDAADAMETALAAASASGGAQFVETFANIRSALYGATAFAALFAASGVELLFDKDYYRHGTEVEAVASDLTGWTYSGSGARTGVNASGNVVSFADGVMPNVAGRGVLVEPGRTRLNPYPQSIGSTGWQAISSATADLAAGTYAGLSMSRLKAGGSNASSRYQLTNTVAIAAATTHATSVFLKKDTSTRTKVSIYNGAVTVQIATVTVAWSAGGVPSVNTSSGASGINFVPLADGAYRLEFTFASGANTDCKALIYPDDLGTNLAVFADGFQIEAGDHATSLITGNPSGTQARGVATLALDYIPTYPVTILVDYEWANASSAVTPSNRYLVTLSTNPYTSTERAILYNLAGSEGLYSESGGVGQASIALAGTAPTNSRRRMVGTYGNNDFRAARNGTAGTPDTSGNVPGPTAKLYIGSAQGAAPSSAYIRRVIVIPGDLTTARQQAWSLDGLESGIVEVSVDETQNNLRTRYHIVNGELVFGVALDAAARTGIFQTKTAIETTKLEDWVDRIILRGDIVLERTDEEPDHDAHVTDGNGQVWDYKPTYNMGDFRAIGYLAGGTDEDDFYEAGVDWLNALGEPGQTNAPVRHLRLYGDVPLTRSPPSVMVSNAYLDFSAARLLPDGVEGHLAKFDGVAAGAMLFRCGVIGAGFVEYADTPTVDDCIVVLEKVHAPEIDVLGDNIGRLAILGLTEGGRFTRAHIRFVGNGANIGVPVIDNRYADVTSLAEDFYYYTQGVGIPVHDRESTLDVASGRHLFEASHGSADTIRLAGLCSHTDSGVYVDAYNVIIQNGWVGDMVIDFQKGDCIYLGSRSDAGEGGAIGWGAGRAYLCSWEGANVHFFADNQTGNRGHNFGRTRMVCAGVENIKFSGDGNTSSGDMTFRDIEASAANRLDTGAASIHAGWGDGLGRNLVFDGGFCGRDGVEDGYDWQADIGFESEVNLPGLQVHFHRVDAATLDGLGFINRFAIPDNTTSVPGQLIHGHTDANYAIYRDDGIFVQPGDEEVWTNLHWGVVEVCVGADGTDTLISRDGSYTGMSQGAFEIWPHHSITVAASVMPNISFRVRG